jgi:hypothetical protein
MCILFFNKFLLDNIFWFKFNKRRKIFYNLVSLKKYQNTFKSRFFLRAVLAFFQIPRETDFFSDSP